MLAAAYPVLINLALIRFRENRDHVAKNKAFDRIFRNGILKGYEHAGEHVRIAETLVNHITILVDEMGIEFVKYLKVIIRIALLEPSLT